jgi:uncharacterized membrane protein
MSAKKAKTQAPKASKSAKARTTPAAKKRKSPRPRRSERSILRPAGSKEPINCKALIEAMAKKGLWTSPGGKTSYAALYSAIIREIALKGKESRFVKKGRGQFAAK